MTSRLTPRRILAWTGIVAAVAAFVTVIASVVLSHSYRPAAPGEPSTASEGWLVLHTSAASILGMASFAAFLVLVWPTGRPSDLRRPLPIGLAAVATLAAAAAIVTRDLLTFDQIALASVSVGDGIAGYWFAAFDDDVRFLLVDGAEVAQSAYARTLAVHLVSPMIAAAALAVALASVRRSIPTPGRAPSDSRVIAGPSGGIRG